jgi:hypothetical protein
MCTIFCTWLNTSYRNTVYRNTPLIGTHLAGPVSYVLYAENTFYRNIIATVTENKRTKAKPPLDNHSPSFFPTVLSLSLAVVFPRSTRPLFLTEFSLSPKISETAPFYHQPTCPLCFQSRLLNGSHTVTANESRSYCG